jgi:hypothetical protein
MINPYDFCVANKIINGKQCTVVWHVDDLKVSHVDPAVMTSILDLLDGKYGQEVVGGKRSPLTITRGVLHYYLGMTLDYSESGVVKIDMRDYVKKILDKMPANMDGTATSPAAEHLFQIQDDIELLDEADSKFFHELLLLSYYSFVNGAVQTFKLQSLAFALGFSIPPNTITTSYHAPSNIFARPPS